MIKRFLILASAILFIFSSCSGYEENVSSPAGEMVFRATVDAGTRSVLQDNLQVAWNPQDSIRLFVLNDFPIRNYKLVSNNTEIADKVDFKGQMSGYLYQEKNKFYAVAPYNKAFGINRDGKFSVNLPSSQTALAGTYDPGCFLSVAASEGFTLNFKNVCGGVRVFLTREGVKTIVFRGNENCPLAGKADVTLIGDEVSASVKEKNYSVSLTAPDDNTLEPGHWYYLTTYPVTMEQGYTLLFYDAAGNEVFHKTVREATSIKRSVWGSVEDPPLSDEILDNEIWYTTTDGRLFDYYNGSTDMPELLYNSYRDGRGCLVFKSAVQSIKKGTFSGRETLRTVTLPNSVKQIGSYSFQYCSNLESINFPESLETIEPFAFANVGFTELFIDNPAELPSCAFYECEKLNSVTISENVQKIDSAAFSGCSGLKHITMLSPVPPEGDIAMFDVGEDCIFSIPEGSRGAYFSAFFWDKYRGMMRFIGDDETTLYDHSTDYSRDGELMTLQTATEGTGINLVFMPDGYLDRDLVPGGKFEQRVRRDMEIFFSYEPFRSLRGRFNVYAVKFVSDVDVYDCGYANHRFVIQGKNGDVSVETDQARLYAIDYVPGADRRMPTFVAILCNSRQQVVMMSAAYNPVNVCLITDPCAPVLLHEFGHLIGGLADEYYLTKSMFKDKSGLDEAHSNNLSLNLDHHFSKNAVLWKEFLQDPRYSSEGLGVFIGGGIYYSNQIYRPSQNSIMNMVGGGYVFDMNEIPPVEIVFNAPSRAAIYRSIMSKTEGSDWEYDYEQFALFDEAGRAQAAAVYAKN